MTDQPGMPNATPVKERAIILPGVGQVVRVKNYDAVAQTGTVVVETEETDALVVRVLACVLDAGAAFNMPVHVDPAGTPAGLIDVPRVGMTATFRHADVPVSTLAQQPVPKANNRRVFTGVYDAAGDRRDQDSRPFVAMPSPVQAAVHAQHCLWLTYAPTGIVLGPFNESTTEGDGFLPESILVPVDAVSVRVVPVGGLWRHDPADATESGPDGRVGTEQHLDPAHAATYRNTTLRSDNIISGAFRLNRLVALWEYDDPGVPTAEIDVMQTPEFPVESAGKPRPLRLRLGCHDGFEWSNNTGQLDVLVTWLP